MCLRPEELSQNGASLTTNLVDITEPEIKKKMTQAQKDGQKRYYNKIKLNPEFQEVRRAYSKKHYDNNKSKVIERVRKYQAKVQDIEQLERLYELQQQGLIHVQTGKLTQEQYDNIIID